MNKGSPMMTYRRIALGVIISAALVGCKSEPNKPAPITSINGSSGTYSSSPSASGGSSSSSSAGAAGASSQNTMAMDTSRPNISNEGGSSTSTAAAQSSGNPFQGGPVASSSAAASGERIVYNRRYSDIPKGSYNGGSTYTVSRGDTLFYIAWITGNDYRELAQRNSIAEPYALTVGQTLNVGNGVNNGSVVASNTSTTTSPNATQNRTAGVDSQNSGAYTDTSKQNVDKTLPSSQPTAGSTTSAATGTTASSSVSGVRWRWPTEGKVVDNFSTSEGGNKGVDISGSRGQPIVAAADGRIVYAGNALRGYGNLIIIKHNDDYLSAYAHNDSMLVAEQQEVKAGQKIATMGSTGTTSVRLHFEIRYKGKSVNPLQHLPQR
ncbi:murein hydrolase activator NlpD [Leminorella grimontii]|uniref:murein hydrolase activator NlpD n=1 Tax=Leminorella grimontii TaxID=82981 RepID=UPI0021C418FC|nr:murein hydrolase activator NlpD [Leminorella grimontii]